MPTISNVTRSTGARVAVVAITTIAIAAAALHSIGPTGVPPVPAPQPGADNSAGPTSLASANLWVSANGSDGGGNCVRSASLIVNPDAGGTTLCKTWQKAYTLAQNGDFVGVVGSHGSYTDQTITGTKAGNPGCRHMAANGLTDAETGCVQFSPQTGDVVTINGSLNLNADYVKVKGDIPTMRIDNGSRTYGSEGHVFVKPSVCNTGNPAAQNTDIIVDGVYSRRFIIDGSNNVALINSEFSHLDSGLSIISKCGGAGSGFPLILPTNILIGDDHFADYPWTISGAHMECIQQNSMAASGGATYGTVLRKNIFEGCGQHDYSHSFYTEAIDDPNPGEITLRANQLIENNMFGPATGFGGSVSSGQTISFKSPQAPFTVTFRFNSMDGQANLPGTPNDFAGSLFYGNVINGTWCNFTGIVYSYNAWPSTASTCTAQTGSVGLASPFPWVNAGVVSGVDLHLSTCATPAAGLVPNSVTGGVPLGDYDGQSRPSGNTDAGADQKC